MQPEVIITEAELPQDVLRAIEQGRKIEAIKILREATGLGLANAKVLVDRASRQIVEKNPRPTVIESDIGLPRLLKSLFAVIALYVAYRYFVGA